MRLINFLSI